MNPLVEKYGAQKRWVTWRLEERKGKKTKIPYSLSGTMASSTDEKTWSTYKELENNLKGIVFTHEKNLLGIDLDHCITVGKRGNLRITDERIVQLIIEADTYTELSPSGTGLHLYFALASPLKLVANRHESFEAYTEGRYFTVTEKPYKTSREVRTISPKEALRLLALIGYPWGKKDAFAPENEVPTPPSLLDHPADILTPMFAAKNGDEIRQLYEGNITPYENDASRADMALLSHLAFWTGKNSSKMEELWLASPLGKRKKTQTRTDYRTRSIAVAIEHCKEVYNPQIKGVSAMRIDDPKLKLLYTLKDKRRIYYKNTENLTRILLYHPEFEGTFRLDAYHESRERKMNDTWRPLRDHDAIDVQTRISVLFSEFANISKTMVYDAIDNAVNMNTIDTGTRYILSLVWDRTPRLDSWIHHTYHTPDDEYHKTIGANWLKGLVKRIIQPGCQFDYVLVLEGEQGIKKSTSLLVLAGILGHVETTMSTEQKDFFMQFLGNAIVEFSEGETLSRTEVKRMKALITVQTDKYRAPYGHEVLPHPRRCVFAMTTNQTEYLKDETGNRRWLPVAVTGHVDIAWLKENREQLLAEAYHRVINERETTWEFPEKEMLTQQNLRRIQDPNADAIVNWFMRLTPGMRQEGITTDDVFRNVMNMGFSGAITVKVQMSIADVLRNVLFLKKKQVMIGRVRTTRWYLSEQTSEEFSIPLFVEDTF